MDIIELTSAGASARISRQGAQVIDAQLRGQPLLWLSSRARSGATVPGEAIRGGVPVCFPWFGKLRDGLPQHGFARNRDWSLLERESGRAVFELRDDASTLALWPHRFRAELAIDLDDALHFGFTVTNTDSASFRFTYALHSYFAVGHAVHAQVDGLDGAPRREIGHPTVRQVGVVGFDQPIDAIFEDAPGDLEIRDGARQVSVDATGMTSAVLWNPGVNDAPDIGDEWSRFVCIERGRVGDAAVTLAPGERHTASMRLSPI